MGNKKELTYEDLSKIYSDEEIAESFVFRSSMSAEEKESADEEFRRLRFEQLKNMSDEQILKGELMRMRLLIKDYFDQPSFIEEYSFANQLRKYISLLKKTMVEFSNDIDIHKTKLSRLLNNRENPNIELMYRLEHHSGMMIPATYWYRLFAKKQEEEIKSDSEKRVKEYKRVKNELSFKLTA